jgi:hypothetical protein
MFLITENIMKRPVFILPDQRHGIVKNMFIYTQSDCVDILYELPLLSNYTVTETFYTNRELCEVLTGCILLGCRSGGF